MTGIDALAATIALQTAAASPAEGGESAFDLLRLSWLLLGLTAMGVFGVILLAAIRRAYVRSQKRGRSGGKNPLPGASGDAWSESGRRIRVESPLPPESPPDPEAEP